MADWSGLCLLRFMLVGLADWVLFLGVPVSLSLASLGISSLCLSPLASLPVCTSASVTVPAHDPVAHE